jgi:hypothetical protein
VSPGFTPAAGFEQEPRAPLSLVDPILEQAGAGYVFVLVAKGVRLAQIRHQLLIIVAQLGEYIQRRDEIRVVVQDTLQTADLADRPQRRTTDFAYAFGDGVSGGEDLLTLLIQRR